MDRTVVMVTHDPVAAAHADEVVFLADGRLVDHMESPTADRVLDRLKAFDNGSYARSDGRRDSRSAGGSDGRFGSGFGSEGVMP